MKTETQIRAEIEALKAQIEQAKREGDKAPAVLIVSRSALEWILGEGVFAKDKDASPSTFWKLVDELVPKNLDDRMN